VHRVLNSKFWVQRVEAVELSGFKFRGFRLRA
jgi:hypothetical protein